MNYEEAVSQEASYRKLVGSEFNGKTISRLLVAPLGEAGIAKLMYNEVNKASSEEFYAIYDEFEVWAIFDEEQWVLTGVIDKMRLSQMLLLI